jgi:hypothetical protein
MKTSRKIIYFLAAGGKRNLLKSKLKLFLLLIIPAFIFSSCVIEYYGVKEPCPYLLAGSNGIYEKEYIYSDSTRQIKLRIEATYQTDSTSEIFTNILIFNESGNKNILFDSSCVELTSGTLITRFYAYLYGAEAENTDWYIFGLKKINGQNIPADENTFTLKVNAIINGVKENLVKKLTIRHH